MSSHIANYLRTHRKRWALSQDELAFLLGAKERSIISHYEIGDRVPSKRELLACEIIFGEPCGRVFPRYYASIREGVAERTMEFLTRLEGRTSEAAGVKRKLARAVMKRANNDLGA